MLSLKSASYGEYVFIPFQEGHYSPFPESASGGPRPERARGDLLRREDV